MNVSFLHEANCIYALPLQVLPSSKRFINIYYYSKMGQLSKRKCNHYFSGKKSLKSHNKIPPFKSPF